MCLAGGVLSRRDGGLREYFGWRWFVGAHAAADLALVPSSGSSRSGLLDQGDMCGRKGERAPAHVEQGMLGLIISYGPLLICPRGTWWT
jgi:hypothetical protein